MERQHPVPFLLSQSNRSNNHNNNGETVTFKSLILKISKISWSSEDTAFLLTRWLQSCLGSGSEFDCILIFFFFFFSCFLGPHLQHMEVSRLGVQLELQLPAYTAATVTWDPSRVCDLYHSSQQCQIPNPLSEAKDGSHILVDSSWIHFHCITMGTLDCSLILVLSQILVKAGWEDGERDKAWLCSIFTPDL